MARTTRAAARKGNASPLASGDEVSRPRRRRGNASSPATTRTTRTTTTTASPPPQSPASTADSLVDEVELQLQKEMASASTPVLETSAGAEQEEMDLTSERVETSSYTEQVGTGASAEQEETWFKVEQVETSFDMEQVEMGPNAEQEETSADAEQVEMGLDAEQEETWVEAEQVETSADTEQVEMGANAEQEETISDTDQVEMGSNAAQEEMRFEAEQVETSADAEQIETGSNAEQAETWFQAEQVETSSNADQVEMGLDTDQAKVEEEPEVAVPEELAPEVSEPRVDVGEQPAEGVETASDVQVLDEREPSVEFEPTPSSLVIKLEETVAAAPVVPEYSSPIAVEDIADVEDSAGSRKRKADDPPVTPSGSARRNKVQKRDDNSEGDNDVVDVFAYMPSYFAKTRTDASTKGGNSYKTRSSGKPGQQLVDFYMHKKPQTQPEHVESQPPQTPPQQSIWGFFQNVAAKVSSPFRRPLPAASSSPAQSPAVSAAPATSGVGLPPATSAQHQHQQRALYEPALSHNTDLQTFPPHLPTERSRNVQLQAPSQNLLSQPLAPPLSFCPPSPQPLSPQPSSPQSSLHATLHTPLNAPTTMGQATSNVFQHETEQPATPRRGQFSDAQSPPRPHELSPIAEETSSLLGAFNANSPRPPPRTPLRPGMQTPSSRRRSIRSNLRDRQSRELAEQSQRRRFAARQRYEEDADNDGVPSPHAATGEKRKLHRIKPDALAVVPNPRAGGYGMDEEMFDVSDDGSVYVDEDRYNEIMGMQSQLTMAERAQLSKTGYLPGTDTIGATFGVPDLSDTSIGSSMDIDDETPTRLSGSEQQQQQQQRQQEQQQWQRQRQQHQQRQQQQQQQASPHAKVREAGDHAALMRSLGTPHKPIRSSALRSVTNRSSDEDLSRHRDFAFMQVQGSPKIDGPDEDLYTHPDFAFMHVRGPKITGVDKRWLALWAEPGAGAAAVQVCARAGVF